MTDPNEGTVPLSDSHEDSGGGPLLDEAVVTPAVEAPAAPDSEEDDEDFLEA